MNNAVQIIIILNLTAIFGAISGRRIWLWGAATPSAGAVMRASDALKSGYH